MRRFWEEKPKSEPVPQIAPAPVPIQPVQVVKPVEPVVEEIEEVVEQPKIVAHKPSNTVKRANKNHIGEIRPFYQQVGYEVFKGYEDGKEIWIPTEKFSEAEILSFIYSNSFE